MTIEDILKLKEDLGSGPELLERVGTDPDFRDGVEKMYRVVCGKTVNENCTDCWYDACLEILYYLNKNSMDDRSFHLRAGAVIIDDKNGTVYNRHNLTDEFALEYIKVHPDSLVLFSELPDNLNELLAGNTKIT